MTLFSHTDFRPVSPGIPALGKCILGLLILVSLAVTPLQSTSAEEAASSTEETKTKGTVAKTPAKAEPLDFVLVDRDAFLYIHPDTQSQSARDRFYYRDNENSGSYWVFRLIKEYSDWVALETIADTSQHCYGTASGLHNLKLRLFVHHRHIARTLRKPATYRSEDGTSATIRPGVAVEGDEAGLMKPALPGYLLRFPTPEEILVTHYQVQPSPKKEADTHRLQNGARIRFSSSGMLTVAGVPSREQTQRSRSGIDTKVLLSQDTLRPPMKTANQAPPPVFSLPVSRVKVHKDPRRTRVIYQDACARIEGDTLTAELKEIGVPDAAETPSPSPDSCHIKAGTKLTWSDGSAAGTTRFDQPVNLGPESKETCFRQELRSLPSDQLARPASSLQICFKREELICPAPPEPKSGKGKKRKKRKRR
ncbi:MAG: hypothetical protein CMH54_10900 [Myxococcales bacterium]|nr:hypothetical protein [Myxococcales bacterium]